MVLRRGYRGEVDWWSMGVVLYELLFGKRPFRGKNAKEVANKIVKGPLQFPASRDVSEECYDFIAKLLRKKPEERLGCGPTGVEDIKAHPFLKSIDWELVPTKQIQAVFVPDPERPNFNAMFEAEDILMEDKPLRKNRKSMIIKEPTNDDERYIQEGFKVFDFKAQARLTHREELVKASMAFEREQAGKQDTMDPEEEDEGGEGGEGEDTL